jgi:hypothetical protein
MLSCPQRVLLKKKELFPIPIVGCIGSDKQLIHPDSPGMIGKLSVKLPDGWDIR